MSVNYFKFLALVVIPLLCFAIFGSIDALAVFSSIGVLTFIFVTAAEKVGAEAFLLTR